MDMAYLWMEIGTVGWSCERVNPKTPRLTKHFRCVLNDFFVVFGKSGGIIRNELGKAEPSVLENGA